METLPLLISLVPTIVLLGLVGVVCLRDHMGPVIGVGVAVGVVVCIPVYLMETVIEDFGAGLPGLYERAFVQQVLGASVSEELAIFAGFVLTFRLFQKTRVKSEREVVAAAVAVAIGFTTIENVTAVIASQTPMSTAVSRLLSIVAGHASLQLMMGYFASKFLMGNDKRLWYGCLVFIVPITVHGWGDFSEAVFQAVDADSPQSQWFFSAWIFGVFAYIAGAAIVLFKLNDPKAAA